MSYQEELSRPEWRVKRLAILKRDNYKCKSCNQERPKFINLSKPFGIIGFDEVLAKGYECKVIPTNYKEIEFVKNKWPKQAYYIGDNNVPFELKKLKFALKLVEGDIGGALIQNYNFICFYDQALIPRDITDLNIHHKFYIKGKKPWEYDNEALISLCSNCHKETHERMDIFVYSEVGDKLYEAKICNRCGGSGYLDCFDYFMSGVCFQCWGEGVVFNGQLAVAIKK